MAERDMSPEQREETEQVRRESVNVGPGLGGGTAPLLLPTDVGGHHPESDWLATSAQDAAVPNWTAAEQLNSTAERLDSERAPLRFGPDTPIVLVFGKDLGEAEAVFGYKPGDLHWAAVKLGGRKVMVPVMAANLDEDVLHAPFPKDLIESAREYPEHQFSLEGELALYSLYIERRMPPAGADSEKTLLQPIRSAA